MNKSEEIKRLKRQLEWFNNFADAVMGDRSTYDSACEYADECETEAYGPDYSDQYASIHDFIERWDLEDKAEEVFGEGWEAENDIEQIQQLVGDEYIVQAIVPTNKKEERLDDYITVKKLQP